MTGFDMASNWGRILHGLGPGLSSIGPEAAEAVFARQHQRKIPGYATIA